MGNIITKALFIAVIAGLAQLAACGGSSASPAEAKSPDLNANSTGKTVIRLISTDKTYPNNSYEIISKNGTIVVADPFKLGHDVGSG